MAVSADGKELMPAEPFTVSRIYSFDEKKLLAKQREKDVLREALARGSASVVLRRLASLVAQHPPMLRMGGLDRAAVGELLARYGLTLRMVLLGQDIPGGYWGESEAGLKGHTLYARADTPLHSVLHEAAHFICMSAGTPCRPRHRCRGR